MLVSRNRHADVRSAEEQGAIIIAVDNLFALRQHDVPQALFPVVISLLALQLLGFRHRSWLSGTLTFT
jgi:hypothetical protein